MSDLLSNIENLTTNEKYKLFTKFKPSIIFAIKRAYQKFDSIPLEIQDLEFYAWEAYDDLLKIYHKRKMRKSFTSCLVDAVYWKTLNVCSKYVTNKHKVVNNCMRAPNFMHEDYNLNKIYRDENQTNIINDIGWNHLLENYFLSHKSDLQKKIFLAYVNQTNVTQIARQEGISLSKAKTILHNVIKDLQQIITKKVF